MKINDMSDMDRPYERLINYGPQALSDSELLAILLKTGTKDMNSIDLARSILANGSDNTNEGIIRHNSNRDQGLGVLARMNYEDLIGIRGIGQAKAVTILSAIELGRRAKDYVRPREYILNSPDKIADMYMENMRYYDTEHFMMLLLDSKASLIKCVEISKGTVNASLASARECMIEALRYKAVQFILMHNHPSGDPTPSTADIHLTKKMKRAGELIDIKLIDHIIIGDKCYRSLSSMGLIED